MNQNHETTDRARAGACPESSGSSSPAAPAGKEQKMHIYGFAKIGKAWTVTRLERVNGTMRPVADIEFFGKSQRRACERRCYELNCEVARSLGHPEPAVFQAGR